MEIDASAWPVIRDEPGGRDKNKLWIAQYPDAPRDQHGVVSRNVTPIGFNLNP